MTGLAETLSESFVAQARMPQANPMALARDIVRAGGPGAIAPETMEAARQLDERGLGMLRQRIGSVGFADAQRVRGAMDNIAKGRAVVSGDEIRAYHAPDSPTAQIHDPKMVEILARFADDFNAAGGPDASRDVVMGLRKGANDALRSREHEWKDNIPKIIESIRTPAAISAGLEADVEAAGPHRYSMAGMSMGGGIGA